MTQDKEIMIEAEGVSKSYGDFLALRDISVQVQAGEIVGLLGPNGAGKTTLLKVLTSFFEPSSGAVRVAGIDVIEDPLAVRRMVGYLPENAPLYREMTVAESLQMTADLRAIDPGQRVGLMTRAVRRTGLEEVLGRSIGKLSKGYRQRVGLAQAILHEPRVLILDEPTSGLDPDQIVEVRHLIRELAANATVILSTHILSEVEQTCERVLVLIDGTLKADAKLSDLTASNRYRLGLKSGADVERVAETLRRLDPVREVQIDAADGDAIRLRVEAEADVDLGGLLFERSAAEGWPLRELRPDTRTLESVFHSLSAGKEVSL